MPFISTPQRFRCIDYLTQIGRADSIGGLRLGRPRGLLLKLGQLLFDLVERRP